MVRKVRQDQENECVCLKFTNSKLEIRCRGWRSYDHVLDVNYSQKEGASLTSLERAP